jgi:glucose/mannose-6-phosphate isomerase
MRDLIENFPSHIQESLQIAKKSPLQNPLPNFQQVVISGLGGSGIGGTIVADLAKNFAKVPVIANKEYGIPAFVGPQTLFVACSYSGNTEETLEALEKAQAAGAHCIIISSGGKIIEQAKQDGLSYRIIPGGHPPRAAFGYALGQLVYLFCEAGLMAPNAAEELNEAADFIKSISSRLDTEAHTLAEKIHDKIPVLYAEASIEGVAVRFRQQINENGKMLCWHHVIPEMNHNELVGWTDENPNLAVLFLRNREDYARNQARMEINKTIIGRYTPHVHEIWSEGTTALARTLHLIHLTDFVSLHLGEIRNRDVVEVKVIDFLKGELAKL